MSCDKLDKKPLNLKKDEKKKTWGLNKVTWEKFLQLGKKQERETRKEN